MATEYFTLEVMDNMEHVNIRVPTRTGKPAKMGRHFPVREF